ncbi:MAG TPA: DNA gyrase inhibitor YacG [Candidatus Dormibacteraeota bacterium]|nr:DNA gyrase inhibitor YacG [Candidatus Dormibacteraeota bacterium]
MRKGHSRRGGSANTTSRLGRVAIYASRPKFKEKPNRFRALERKPRTTQNRLMIHRCPICNRTTESEKDPDFPFCSDRCRLLDLGNWASERYVISEQAVEEPASEKSEFNTDEPES